MEIVRREELAVEVSAEERLVAQLERAGQLLSEAKTLDQARKVEGFVRATLEWARRQEEITLAVKNDGELLWLESRARQGEMLRDRPKPPRGPQKLCGENPHNFDRPPTLRELGYQTKEASVLQQIASLCREERGRIAEEATLKQRRLTQQALLEAARKAQKPTPKPVPPEAREPCPPAFPEEFRNAVVIGDARELARQIPDASVAVCICDPVYSRVEDYEWLAEECERVLVDGGNLIVQCGNVRRYDCEVAMRKSGLRFVDLLAEVYPYAQCQLFHTRVAVGWKPHLWFSKGPRNGDWVMNRLKVGGKHYSDDSKEIHPWGDSEQFTAGLLGKLCKPGHVIWDPFTGSGTVPTVAAKLGLPFVAFEIDPETASLARHRIAGTPRISSPQMGMEFEADDGDRAGAVLSV